MKVFITGSAGFIGYHLTKRMLSEGHEVMGIDSINDYYDIRLKYDRLANSGINPGDEAGKRVQSTLYPGYTFVQGNLENADLLARLFKEFKPDLVINLAAQAGVLYSLQNPYAYINSNIVGFTNILEQCRYHKPSHLLFASSSSVYGLNTKMPLSVSDNVDHPISLYAATKKSNELMAHTYSHLFGLPATGLRFFTVYGPWGRPDMALFIFTKAILDGKVIDVHNFGNMVRDFTYVDDIVEGIVRVSARPPVGSTTWDSANPDPSNSPAPYRLYNIGNSNPVKLLDYIEAIEKATGITARKNLIEMQAGEVPYTHADCKKLEEDFGYKPGTPVSSGIQAFVNWFKGYYNIQ
jgi:UDP-glucuronate 4-epimerase